MPNILPYEPSGFFDDAPTKKQVILQFLEKGIGIEEIRRMVGGVSLGEIEKIRREFLET